MLGDLGASGALATAARDTAGATATGLRDPIWQFVGVLIAAAALVSGPWMAWMQGRGKRLAYEPLSLKRVLSYADELRSRLTVLFDGRPVHDCDLLLVRLANTGAEPVRAEDVIEAITFTFAPPAQLLSCAVAATDPPELRPSTTVTEQDVVLAPLLLNPGDTITLRCILSGFGGHLRVTGRVVGVRAIGERVTSRPRHLAYTVGGAAASMTGALLASFDPRLLPGGWWQLALFVGGLALYLYGAGRSKLTRRLQLRRGGSAIPYDWDSPPPSA